MTFSLIISGFELDNAMSMPKLFYYYLPTLIRDYYKSRTKKYLLFVISMTSFNDAYSSNVGLHFYIKGKLKPKDD